MSARAVVVYHCAGAEPLYAHEQASLQHVAREIAAITGRSFAGNHAPTTDSGTVFCVPDETLLEDEARRLKIVRDVDFFGGVVGDPLARTKAIGHELVTSDACRPPGWCTSFAERVRDVVLPGRTAFNKADAIEAARSLLAAGPIRAKNSLSSGGGGQRVATTIAEVEAILERVSANHLERSGVVIETHLREVVTRSVGQVVIGTLLICYHGTQRTTRNNHGRPVYGGSDLLCVRGGWDAIERLALSPHERIAVAQARRYDAAADAHLPGFLASRRNYDVAQGLDGKGDWRSGVLEASWRAGGASPAEVAAAQVFIDDPACHTVQASAIKKFGRDCAAPPGALVYWQGEDPRDGPVLRCSMAKRRSREE